MSSGFDSPKNSANKKPKNGVDVGTAKRAARAAPNATKSEEAETSKMVAEAGAELVHLEGLRAFYRLRKKWSWFILVCISLLILFQIVVTVMVGCGVLDFKEYKWFLPMVITENFAQIIGLAIIVVTFLFSAKAVSSAR